MAVDSQSLRPALGSVCQLPWLHKMLCTRQVMPSAGALELCEAACALPGWPAKRCKVVGL